MIEDYKEACELIKEAMNNSYKCDIYSNKEKIAENVVVISEEENILYNFKMISSQVKNVTSFFDDLILKIGEKEISINFLNFLNYIINNKSSVILIIEISAYISSCDFPEYIPINNRFEILDIR